MIHIPSTSPDDSGSALYRDFLQTQLARSERRAAGKALRERTPRADHGIYVPRPDRPDPIATILAQNDGRVESLVPVRMGRMLASPFAFLRGSAAVMAADLAPSPRIGIPVMACGDMHVSNFGLFASAERNLVFAINDFDEAHPGPWEWDVKRLAASAAVAARFLGGDRHDAKEAAHAAVSGYVRWIDRYSRLGLLEIWYCQIDEQDILDVCPKDLRKTTRKLLDKARARGHFTALERLTHTVDGDQRLIEDHPIIVRETHMPDGRSVEQALDRMLQSYVASLSYERRRLLMRYTLIDVVRKVVGVGSVGLECWVLFLRGEGKDDPLFLQVKEARPSVLAPYAESQLPMENQGHRVVAGQRLIQGSPDIFLGWGPNDGLPGKQYYVRQLADMKGGVKFAEGNKAGIKGLVSYARLCGRALALAHAKSGDASMISGYCGRSDALPDVLARFALAYAEQTEADHAALDKAARAGRFAYVVGK